MLPPAHASGVARATEDPLARTACFGRAAPPGAPPPSRFPAAAVDRRRLRAAFRSCQPQSPAGVLTERTDSLCNGKRDGCQGYFSYGSECSPDGATRNPGIVRRGLAPATLDHNLQVLVQILAPKHIFGGRGNYGLE